MTFRKCVLSRAVHAVSIDPLSHRELGACELPVGTCLEGAAVSLSKAEASGEAQVTVRVAESDGDVALKRMAVSDLREALARAGSVG
jgi:hypothetical protein